MLRALNVRDFVIVDSLSLDFASGFSVMTGETGAGKSIMIDALQLALGGRGESSMVREGAKRADITAEFSVDDQTKEWLVVNEIDSEEDGVLLRRTIDAESGRSRCFINGAPVTAMQMRSLGELLVDIHGQHAHQLLMKTGEQRLLLDRHAGLTPKVAELGIRYRKWKQLEEKITQATASTERMQEERERLEWQLKELEKVAPKEGEWEQVSQDYDRLSHAASLLEGIGSAVDELSESDNPMLSRLGSINQTLSGLASVDRELEPVVEMLENARIQLQEAVYSLRDYLAHTDLDPEQLNVVGERMEALHTLARRFKVDPEQLPEEFLKRREALSQFEQDHNLKALQEEARKAETAYQDLAEQVSKARHKAGEALGHAVTDIMQELHMTGGSFAVDIRKGEPASHGTDLVEFLVSGHAGAALRPLAKVASGGELARVSLALSVIASDATATPTLVFDEVDSGVGGGVAEVVGKLLRRLGNDHQVLCVTHLPQVASQAKQHFQVSKQAVANVAHPVSRITELTDDARVTEIARMLGGTELTETAMDHAREMLGQPTFRLV
ncbi:MAG: DNA repair protein RecN [Oxalobacter sp.]|nr:DNA repair protein RecN [Oxalobacter sp.]